MPGCILGIDIAPDYRMFPRPNTIKQKACKLTFQAILIGHAKWEPVILPEPTQCGIGAGVLVGTNSLCDSSLCSLHGAYGKRLWATPGND